VKLVCIINPVAGPHRDPEAIAARVRAVAAAAGWDATCRQSPGPGRCADLAREAAADADIVVAAGGDGTVHDVATGLVGTNAALAIVPAGSGNGMARSLGLPLDVREAIDRLPMGEARAHDVGTMDGRMFFCTVGFGIDAEAAWRYAATTHERGVLPYVWHAVLAWFAREPETVRVTIDGHTRTERVILFVVSNIEQYGAGAKIAPGARPDDGLLRICLLAPTSSVAALVLLPRLFRGTLDRSWRYRCLPAKEVVVERARPGRIQIDGEPAEGTARLRFGIMPGALRVWLPAPSAVPSRRSDR